MSIILIISILLAIFIISLGIIALKSNFRKKINYTFFALTVIVSLWEFLYILSTFPNDFSLLIFKLADVVGLLMAILLARFALIYPKNDFSKTSNLVTVVSVIGIILFVPIIIFSSLVVLGVENSSNMVVPIGGKLSWPFLLFVGIFVSIGVVVLLFKFFKTYRQRSFERTQLSYVVLGLGITASIILAINLVINIFGDKISTIIDVLNPFSVVIFIIFTAYGILKGGLFDVRAAIVRSVTYSLVVATMAGIYVGTTSLLSAILGFGQSTWAELLGNIVISLVLVFIFQPIKKFFDKITNKIFYKDNYSTDDFVARLNKTLAYTTDLRMMLKQTAIVIATTLKGNQASFLINSESSHYISAGTAGHTVLTKIEAEKFNNAEKMQDGVVIASLLEEDDPVRIIMDEKKIDSVLPLKKDEEVVGYLVLGEHKTSSYTTRDIKLLQAVSNGLIIAIQNALAVQEIRDFNVTLRQKITEATQELRIKNAMLKKLDKAKDEFVSMASHQLRTPLTSVKGYLSMVIEGDAGKVSKPQKDLLDEAFSSNEKMVHLVNDFLNVSRIQTGKFMLEKAPVDLPKLVTEEIDGLRQNAKAHNLNLVYKAPSNFPLLNIDEGKIRQVVMNFADNALYYSHPNTDVNISLSIDGDDALFTVIDTGIGVPIDEQGQLFTKFYRASNARKTRPDGTGVGLYLAKKIITAHDGKIVFSTIEGRGSTFGFRLPIKELELSADKEIENLKTK